MKSIAGLQDTFTLSLVKGAANRVRPKVPAAGEAWQGGEVASHEVNRAPGTLCHAGKKELLTLYTFCSAKSSYNHPVPLRQFWNNSETIWGQLKDNLGTIRDKLETTVGQFFDSTRRKFWKILEITLGQLLDEIKTTLGQHCDYLVIIVGTYLCPATNDHTSYHLDSEHAHLLGCFPRPSGKASGEVSLDEAWRAAGARDVREP